MSARENNEHELVAMGVPHRDPSGWSDTAIDHNPGNIRDSETASLEVVHHCMLSTGDTDSEEETSGPSTSRDIGQRELAREWVRTSATVHVPRPERKQSKIPKNNPRSRKEQMREEQTSMASPPQSPTKSPRKGKSPATNNPPVKFNAPESSNRAGESRRNTGQQHGDKTRTEQSGKTDTAQSRKQGSSSEQASASKNRPRHQEGGRGRRPTDPAGEDQQHHQEDGCCSCCNTQ